MTQGHRIQITVALIGVAGAIVVAVISNLDKLLPNSAPVATRAAPLREPPVDDSVQAPPPSRASSADRRQGTTSSAAFALRTYVFPRERALWPSRREIALVVMQELDLLPLVGSSPSARLAHILNDDDREQERRALIQGIISSSSVDEAARTELRDALAN